MLTFLTSSGVVTEVINTTIESSPLDVLSLDDMYIMMNANPENKSLVKKYLTKELVKKYKDIKTSGGGSLALCVRTNSTNSGAMLCRCADIECYDVFNEFFEPLIKEYHKIISPSVIHPPSKFGDIDDVDWADLDPTGRYVISTRIRVARSIQGFALAPLITKQDRLNLELKLIKIFSYFIEEYGGSYYPLSTMNRHTFDKLVADHFLFRDDDSVLRDAGGYRDWPSGRGIYLNNKKNFIIWVNEEDHIRIISMEAGSNLSRIYQRLIKGIQILEKYLDFSSHKRYGYITFCPSNLGTSMFASVHIKIPYFSTVPNFKEICQSLGLQARGTYGEHTESIGGVYDLGNEKRLGLSELDAVSEMAIGIRKIVIVETLMEHFNANMLSCAMAVEPLEYLFDLLDVPENKSLTKKYLTKEIVKKYKNLRTSKGSTLSHCIRNCAYNHRAACPRTGDAECYDLFREYIDRIIMDYHGALEPDFVHPRVNFGDIYNLPFSDLDPAGQHVVSTRIRVGRSVKGFNFPTTIDKAQRLRLESVVSEALMGLTGELAGTYYPLGGMNVNTQKQLIDDHFLFKEDDPVLRDAGGYRHWPSGRGIFHNIQKNFLVWVCEEDHIRIISMQMGGNVADVYRRLVEGVGAIEDKLPVVRTDRLGYLTCCPSNIGTTMRASVHLKIPKLSSNREKFDEICNKFNLQARGFYGEHTESTGGIYDISNLRRLGLTELEAVTEMVQGVKALINCEELL